MLVLVLRATTSNVYPPCIALVAMQGIFFVAYDGMLMLVLRPQPQPFNFIDKWSDPLWKRCGVYLWTIEYRGAYLASYAGQCFKGGSNFDIRIWQELKWWKSGQDWPVDIEQYKQGRRVELAMRPEGHTTREFAELMPLFRIWLMALDTKSECDQAERWLVAQLCKHPLTRQFLANRTPERYQPDPNWCVQFDAPASFRVFGLTTDVIE